jgi:alpha-L-rhamnosidase
MRNTLLTTLFAGLIGSAAAQTTVAQLRVEHLVNPLGIEARQPRLSWQLTSGTRNTRQTAYEIRVGAAETALAKGTAWQSGRVMADSSVDVAYKGAPLLSGRRYQWQVRVWDQTNQPSAWSTPGTFQMGLLTANDWLAQWIEPNPADTTGQPAALLRKAFTTRKAIRSASLFATAHGMYEAHLNGQRVGDAYLTPGWTSYNKRLQYQTYDVTALLRPGQNALGVMLGSGWYRGNLAWSGAKNHYGKDLALLCQLQITYADGTTETIVSDGSWQSQTGAVRHSEVYHGETADARLDKPGWATATYTTADWHPVVVSNFPKNHLVSTENELVKKHEVFTNPKVIRTPKGETVLDFGQNLVGWVMLRATGRAGSQVRLSHAEVLDKKGNFYTENLRLAKCQNTYILRGTGQAEFFEPHFTWQGFRYVRIEGDAEVKPESCTAVTLYSAMPPTGTFTCSEPLVNQLQQNIQWGQRGNFLDVPTDCPQRDERLGWTGDAQAFARTAAFNYGVQAFFSKWLKDVAADQLLNGSVPFVVPNVLGTGAAGSAGWADVATIAPWTMYVAYGDRQVLATQYPSMKAWVDFMLKQSALDDAGRPLWNKGFHFGDWLFYRPFDDNDGRSAVTDKYLIAQCFFAHSTQLLVNTAKVLGRADDQRTYEALLGQVKEAFRQEYVTPGGRLLSNTQTAHVLALHFDMLPERQRAATAQRLADNVKSYGNHLTTGFLGTPYLCHVLSRFGYDKVAYDLLLQTSYPSWLYPVKMGATTIWERWDGIKPDSTFQTPGMNSYNHYAYGAIGDWMYRVAAGLDTDEQAVGYRRLRIRPHLDPRLTMAEATLQTPYGQAKSGWKREGNKLTMTVEVPANTTAQVSVPAQTAAQVRENGQLITGTAADGYVTVEIGSGTYRFEVDK